MSFRLNDNGPNFFARLVTGSGERLNYMFVEFGTEAGSLVEHSFEYFENLSKIRGCGYAAVPVVHSYVDTADGVSNVAHFSGSVAWSDVVGKLPAKGARIKSVTMAYVADPSKLSSAVLVGTCQIENEVLLIKNGYAAVNTSIAMG